MGYDTIILSGGASRGYYQLGCLSRYRRDIEGVTRYVGTSVGSMICLLMIVGYSPPEIMEIALSMEMTYPRDNRWISMLTGTAAKIGIDASPFMMGIDIVASWITMIVNLFTYHGMMRENPYIPLLRKHIKAKMGRIPTMAELHMITGKELICTTSCLNSYDSLYLTRHSVPDMSVLTAVDMSSRVPLLFSPMTYMGSLYVDGGLTDHFPVSQLRGNTLAIYTRSQDMGKNPSFMEYLWSIVDAATKGKYVDIPIRDDVTLHIIKGDGGNMTATREEAMVMYMLGYLSQHEEGNDTPESQEDTQATGNNLALDTYGQIDGHEDTYDHGSNATKQE